VRCWLCDRARERVGKILRYMSCHVLVMSVGKMVSVKIAQE
jgi:hypothetical protein